MQSPSDDLLDRANDSVRKGARFGVLIMSVLAAVHIAGGVYNGPPFLFWTALLAAVGLFYAVQAWRFSRLRFTSVGIELPDDTFIPWSKIEQVEERQSRASTHRYLRLDTGEVFQLFVWWAWPVTAIDALLQRKRP